MSPSVAVDHPREVLVVHGVSSLCMAVMLVAAVPGWATRVGVLAFGAATGWCLLQALRRFTPAVHLRLALCCLAMVAMLAPQMTVQATAPVTAGAAMHGSTTAAAPTWTALVLAGALLIVAVTVLVTRTPGLLRRGHRHPRPSDVVEPVMAAMLVGLV